MALQGRGVRCRSRWLSIGDSRRAFGVIGLAIGVAASIAAQPQVLDGPSPAELQQAEADVPKLVEVLELRPGMSVADVGAGAGAMVTVLSRTLGPTSRIYGTDIGERQLEILRKDRRENVTIIEGGERSTNLPEACCDAIYMRDVYHHFTHPEEMNRSLRDSLKPGGRLAIIDFEPRRGSPLPDRVNPNRGGHGIPPNVLEGEVISAGFAFDRSIEHWPDEKGGYFLALFRKK